MRAYVWYGVHGVDGDKEMAVAVAPSEGAAREMLDGILQPAHDMFIISRPHDQVAEPHEHAWPLGYRAFL